MRRFSSLFIAPPMSAAIQEGEEEKEVEGNGEMSQLRTAPYQRSVGWGSDKHFRKLHWPKIIA